MQPSQPGRHPSFSGSGFSSSSSSSSSSNNRRRVLEEDETPSSSSSNMRRRPLDEDDASTPLSSNSRRRPLEEDEIPSLSSSTSRRRPLEEDETAQRASKRPRLEEEECTPSGRRHLRRTPYGHFARVGRHMTRTRDAFAPTTAVLNTALDRANHQIDGVPFTPTPEQARHLRTYDETIGADPGLHEDVMGASAEDLSGMAGSMRYGQQLARSDDTMSLKRRVTTWIEFPPNERVPHIDRKHERGYNNNTTGRLIAPAEAELTEDYMARLREGTATLTDENGRERLVNGADHRNFMIRGEYDREEPLRGFLQSDILVRAYRTVFTSPSSADVEDPSSSRSTRRGNAALNDMTEVTPASIAYIVVQVYFALSSRTVFSVTCSPEILEMYESILAMFDSDVPYIRNYMQELLRWWNAQIFPRARIVDRRGSGGSLCRLEARYRDYDTNGRFHRGD